MEPIAWEHTVVAHNPATASENKIHEDTVARDYGFRGGLVPGVVVYAYMTHAPLERWGRDWLERGTMAARFHVPVYEGQEVTVTLDDDGELEAYTEDGLVASGAASLPHAVASPPDADGYPVAPLPDERPPASAEALSVDALGTLEYGFHARQAGAYLDEVREASPFYAKAGVAHPGWLIAMANYALSQNVRLGPWIHVETQATHFSALADGERVVVRGKVAGLFEKKGHKFVDLDLLWLAGDDRPVLHARHTAIYEPRRGRS
jgi:acyl-coenzyme A thioesterase PaaI-like protein